MTDRGTIQRIGIVTLVCILALVAGATSAWAQSCNGQGSAGTNYTCYNVAACGEYVWCVQEICAWNTTCSGYFNGYAQGCAWGGCFNPFQINCDGGC